MPRIRHTLLCFSADAPPVPAEIAATLRGLGHTAEVTLEERSAFTARTFELAVAPAGTRILIEIGEDLHRGTDVATSDWETVLDLANLGSVRESELPNVRRVVHIGYWDHADGETVRMLLRLLCAAMQAREVPEA